NKARLPGQIWRMRTRRKPRLQCYGEESLAFCQCAGKGIEDRKGACFPSPFQSQSLEQTYVNNAGDPWLFLLSLRPIMVCHTCRMVEQPIDPVEETSTTIPKEKIPEQTSPDEEMQKTVNGTPQVYHGPFSNCHCQGCLEDAKKEAEKRFDSNTLAFGYIKKLEGLVNQLQIGNNEEYNYDMPAEVYRGGRMRRRSSIESLGVAFDNGRFTFPSGPSGPLVAPKETVELDESHSFGNKGPKVEIKKMKKFYYQYGEPIVERDRTTPNALTSTDLSKEHVLSVFREYDRKKNFWRRTLEIRSPPFIELLRHVAYSDVDLPAADDMLRLKEPLMPLFYTRAKLVAWLESGQVDPNDVTQMLARKHLILILEFLKNECQDVMKAQDNLEIANASSTIKYEHAWLLYAPGTVVLSKENGEYEAFVVESVRGCQRHQPSYNSRFTHSTLEITCWSINYDGEVFGRVWSTHYVAPFEGSKEVSSLDLVPEAFVSDRELVRESLMGRGQRFWALQGQCFREYTGEVWSSQMNEDPIRVMVDHLTYQRRMNWPIEIDRKRGPADAQGKNWRENRFLRGRRGRRESYSRSYSPRRRPRPRTNRNIYAHGDGREYSPPDPTRSPEPHEEAYERVDCDRPLQAVNAFYKKYDLMEANTEPDELTKLLCPQLVHGYCLRDKVWKKLNVTQLQPVKFRQNAWERLVLDEEYKDIVQAMVSSYVDKTTGIDDLIAGKGAGLVTLLHGPPGTGKTLTAECVAESFGKPLYQVTCGEIGTHASRLEERLGEIFDDAVTWGAILVLDEADVFLQERDYENLERNALVSIFLRTLEYFNGILFLTTNRVGTFDQAFQSRIHITLGLPILDQPRRTEVWTIFLHELAKSQKLTPTQLEDLQSQAVSNWSRQSLNGRQIRNSVRTALLVAEKKKEVVGEKHFETVLRIGREFENYMSVLRKGDADVIAEVKGDRLADLGGFQEV
ncbi:MAG: hypothetical protein Q9224_004253, partial [Gallowayella concinna]